MVIVFWACLATVIYVYLGYPLLLSLDVFGRPMAIRRERSPASWPTVSVIVAAHNEESQIEAKIRNILDSEYPRARIEILIGSDGSSDKTDSIVRRFVGQGVGLISFPQQQGKSAMQNRLVAAASGEILVFSDADCYFSSGVIAVALQKFADPRVGLVTARPRYTNEADTAITKNEGLYLRYETWLRREESRRGSLAMASGSFVAMRRSLWRPLQPALGDDFVLPLRCALAQMLNILDERISVVTRLSEHRPRAMLRTKIRIITKDFRALLAHASLLDPFRYRALAISLWSHKLLRWLVPYFLIANIVSTCFLLDRPFFRAMLALQIGFYGLALLGCSSPERLRSFPWSVPASFCIVNLAALIGTAKCFAGRTSGRWTPARARPSTIHIDASTHSRELK